MKKIICSFLAMAMISNFSAYALIDTTFTNTYQIGDGITYTHVAGTTSTGPQRSNIIEYTPNESVSPFIAYGESVYGGSTILTASEYIESLGNTVLGGMNADFFTMSTGVPLGLVIADGQIVSSDSWQNAIAFKADGSAFIDRPGMDMKLYYGDTNIQVNYFNKMRTDSYVYLFDSNFSTETKNTTSGTDIILQRLDENLLTPTSDLSFEVVDIIKNTGSYPILENQFVLSIDDKLASSVPSVAIGDVVTLSTRVSNTEWNDVTYAVGGQTILIQDGEIQSNLGSSTNPRTAFGIKADGTIVVYENDGRDSSFSNGLSLTDLAAELYALGCVNAINLDGGGSSSVVIQFAGYDDVLLTNNPSEGSLRSNANYIFFLNNEEPTGELSDIKVYTENNFMLLNSSIEIYVKGYDENYYAVEIGDDYQTVTDYNSEIIDGIYTSNKTGEVEITATYDGLSNSTKVTVLDSVDSISILNQENDVEITDLSINQNDSINLKATASYRYLPVAASNESFTWEVIGDVGDVTPDGIFTATNKKSDGSILISYGNNSSKTISVSIGLMNEPDVFVITGFETPYDFEITNGEQSYSNLKVANGKNSTMINYDFGEENSTILSCTQLLDYYDTLNFKVLGDGTENSLYANFLTEEGIMIQMPAVDSLESTIYQSVSVSIPSVAVSFAGFSIKEGSSKTGAIYLDHITLSNVQNDNKAPIITLSEVPTNASEVSITGTIVNDDSYAVNKDNISVTINGDAKSFSYTVKDGSFSFSSSDFDEGINRLVIKATDTFGNIAIEAFDIIKEVEVIEEIIEDEELVITEETTYDTTEDVEENTEESQEIDSDTDYIISEDTEILELGPIVFQDIDGHWASNYIEYASRMGIVNGETKEGLWYFNPSRNLTRGEFAVIMSRLLELETEVVISEETIDENGEIIPAVVETISADNDFSDLEDIASWALPHVIAVSNAGIMNGVLSNDGSVSFNSQNSITRAEVITVLGRIIDKGFDITEITFNDNENIPSWSFEHFESLVNLGILNGYTDNTIMPLNNITRAEACKLIYMIK